MLKLFFTSFFLSFPLIIVDCSLVLNSVSVILRHGDRNPLYIYPNDPYDETYWKQHGGVGTMTEQGKNRIKIAAKFYRQHYEMLLQESDGTNYQVITSTVNRAIETANIFMKEINKNATFQRNDNMLFMYAKCDKATKLRDDRLNELAPELLPNNTFMDYLRNKTGDEFTDEDTVKKIRLLFDLADTLKIERDQLNMNVSDWITDKETVKTMSETERKIFAKMSNTPEIQRLRVGLLLKDIRDQMEKNPSQRFYLYSTHDFNQAVLLQALDMYDRLDKINQMPPTYVSSVVFEVFHNETNEQEKWIRFIYRQFLDINGTIMNLDEKILPEKCQDELEFHDGTVLNTGKFCSWQQFTNELLKDLIPDNWDKECQNSSFANKPMWITLMIFITILMSNFSIF
ncbi:lysosomal acid phosphatase precursor-like protein [Dermatophagoides farinae]|uniref:acid phosphatase n=1 Tax=Dermatophagoides farinae TaxID=6954 RepID=A0A9D4P909_DERFA|nr:prostatic acid phosphatase-like [Dermatophagoides farinae]KAH7646167.1 lysosomal acid phosphatase precursor-like protein [Dermatophagoides farinae]